MKRLPSPIWGWHGAAAMIYRGRIVTCMDLADILMHQQENRPRKNARLTEEFQDEQSSEAAHRKSPESVLVLPLPGSKERW